jgi:hypothetical protein
MCLNLHHAVTGLCIWYRISLMKQQFVTTHSIRQTEIPALLDNWVTNTLSAKTLCPQKDYLSLYFWSTEDQLIFFVSCKTVYGGLQQTAVSWAICSLRGRSWGRRKSVRSEFDTRSTTDWNLIFYEISVPIHCKYTLKIRRNLNVSCAKLKKHTLKIFGFSLSVLCFKLFTN